MSGTPILIVEVEGQAISVDIGVEVEGQAMSVDIGCYLTFIFKFPKLKILKTSTSYIYIYILFSTVQKIKYLLHLFEKMQKS